MQLIMRTVPDVGEAPARLTNDQVARFPAHSRMLMVTWRRGKGASREA